ncbi:MAG: OmpH family outer membrane protein [Pseudomonadota bacterium]|uniref:OmpH family outer membrane protein n=1 Tax=Sphingomonas sp. ERG5 TaxID=1381597 RepID=UPI00190F49A3|nr:OmpH family outer membrane protein [Sphingomonas sp. ERG5]
MTSAQTASPRVGGAPAQPAAAPLGGPIIAGICLLSREAIFANAEVGKVATARLLELTKAAQAEIDNERTPLETEARTLETQRASLSADQLRQRSEAMANRWQALQQKAAHNGREIEATRAKALDRIATEAQPVIAQVYAGKNCGLLLDRGAALGGNYANDLTAGVVEGLNARIRTISFERERLPAQPATNGQGQRSQ